MIAVLTFILWGVWTVSPANQAELSSQNLGSYSLSLNVKDILASMTFYQKLGFEPVEGQGSAEQKWIMLSNGEAKIGLFQGMFPMNTLTFTPADGRAIHKMLISHGITPVFAIGLDKEEGPCSFSIIDPDGNPILIDQH